MGLILPVPSYSGLSSWQAHINRFTPSTEPGTDFYVPIGTPVVSPAAGYIWGYGTSIVPATGRWVGVNFDNGMSFRTLHNSALTRTSGRVEQGELLAYSGASGYGEEDWSWNVAETGGAHTHVTLWPTWAHQYDYQSPGVPYTVDFMAYVAGFAGEGSQPFEEDDMYDDAARTDLYRKVETESRPLKLYQWGSGIIAVGPGGKQWPIPSGAYVTLLAAVGLAGDVIRVVSDTELGFVSDTLGMLAPDPAVTAQAEHVLSLSPEDAANLASQISTTVGDRISSLIVGADEADLGEIAKAVADEQDRRTRERIG